MTSLLSSLGAACAFALIKTVLTARPAKATRHEISGIELSPEHFVFIRLMAVAAVVAGSWKLHDPIGVIESKYLRPPLP
jgi:hypothetical protein